MLEAVSIDEEALIEVDPKVHLLGVILVESSNVLVQIALVENPMEALTRPDLAESILRRLAFLVAYAFIGDRQVRWHFEVVLQINLIIQIAEALQSPFFFHLFPKSNAGEKIGPEFSLINMGCKMWRDWSRFYFKGTLIGSCQMQL